MLTVKVFWVWGYIRKDLRFPIAVYSDLSGGSGPENTPSTFDVLKFYR